MPAVPKDTASRRTVPWWRTPGTRAAAIATVLAILTGWGFSGIDVIDTEATPSPTVSASPTPTVRPNTHPVDRVVDGDTVRILRNDKSVALRLIGGDTPETVHPTQPVQCYGPEASAEAKRVLEGEDVTVVYDPTQGTLHRDGRYLDYYQRDLVYLELADGTDFMEHMIRQGFAEEYTYRGSVYERQDEYREAEAEAMRAGRGIWSAC